MTRVFSSLAGWLTIASVALAAPSSVHLLRTPDDGIQPQAAVDSHGRVHLIYFKGSPQGGDIFYVHRDSRELSFSKPIQVNTQPGTAIAIGTIRGAQLAIGKNDRVHVAWDGMGDGRASAKGSAKVQHPLFYTRLNDSREAFEPERNIITFAYGLDGGSSVAADRDGHVYVTWHAPQPGNTNGEAGRAVFISRSTDEGKTFAPEKRAIDQRLGACACCGMRSFADASGLVYILFRTATEQVNRNETLLLSRDHGATFSVAYSHQWKLTTCPMSSAFISQTPADILAAAETHGRVFFVSLDPKTGETSPPVVSEVQGKHPVAIANSRGQTLFVWTEGTGWNKGGSVAWQIYDSNGTPSPEKGKKDGLPTWSLPTAFANPDNTFSIIY